MLSFLDYYMVNVVNVKKPYLFQKNLLTLELLILFSWYLCSVHCALDSNVTQGEDEIF